MLYKIRGEDVEVNKEDKMLQVKIRIPLDGEFSISDRIYNMLWKGYTAFVVVKDREYIITAHDTPQHVEKVPTKFEGAKPWHRYWYTINELGGIW